MGRLQEHIRLPSALRHNNRTQLETCNNTTASKCHPFTCFHRMRVSLGFFFYGCMISKDDNLEKPVSQMRVLESTAFCCANFEVGGRCILFVASPVLMLVTLYDQPSLSWNLMICDRTKGQFVSDKKWLLCWISTYYAVKEKVTLWSEQLFSVCAICYWNAEAWSHNRGVHYICFSALVSWM